MIKSKAVGVASLVTSATLAMANSPLVMAVVACPPGSANPNANTAAECSLVADSTDLMTQIGSIINIVVGVLGVVAVLVIIFGGVQYVTSAGDAGKVKKAKDTILYGVIGLIVALLAYAIVNFAIDAVD